MPTRLEYTIHSSSGHTSSFRPELILVDEPHDQASRWTGVTTKSSDEMKQGVSYTGLLGAADSLTVPVSGGDDSHAQARPFKKRKRDVQYITVELHKPSIVHKIGFGKYQKVHPCNLFEFTVAGGMSPDPRYMEPLLYAGLRNDTNKELFDLPTTVEGTDGTSAPLPCRYIRIEALSAHSANYNVSIWHLWLEGVSDTDQLEVALKAYDEHREQTTTHLILAHLRRSSLLPSFSALHQSIPPRISASFEHALLSEVHHSLVVRGNFTRTEELLDKALSQGLFDDWQAGGTKGTSVGRWSLVSMYKPDSNDAPSPRAGHQVLRVGRKMLLFGGWNGEQDLGDLWEADLPRKEDNDETPLQWRMLEQEDQDKVSKRERPRARSCHQMATDEQEGWVYLLGGKLPYTDPVDKSATSRDTMDDDSGVIAESKPNTRPLLDPWASDFWRYKAVGPGKGTWQLLSTDTESEKGPRLLFDHQMFINQDLRMLFVFGGKNQPPTGDDPDNRHSGFYCYDLDNQRWSRLFGDPTSQDSFRSERLLSRFGHQMLYDQELATVFILSGQRGDTYLSDLWAVKLMQSDDERASTVEAASDPTEVWRAGSVVGVNLDDVSSAAAPAVVTTGSNRYRAPTILHTKRLAADYSSYGPPAAFTQRSTIDQSTGTWTLMSGLVKDRTTLRETTAGELWQRTRAGKWSKVDSRGDQPCGRYAAQIVYDPLRKEHYLHGGNPSQSGDEPRLGDCWRLKIVDPSPPEALRKVKFLVRKQKFIEMCQTRPTLMALDYLQTTLAAVVDHSDESEAASFRACMTALLSAPSKNNCDIGPIALAATGTSDGMVHDDDGQASVSASSSFSSASWIEEPIMSLLTQDSGISVSAPGTLSEPERKLYNARQALFEQLLGFMVDAHVQPKQNLVDLANKRDYMT
ncbi:hypothetical protein OIV83_001124 [Microbotryomycetes sp. JL201]|nr:hypothetical protein OIV83_001124 [Microbotryomycetes sp. JL201]